MCINASIKWNINRYISCEDTLYLLHITDYCNRVSFPSCLERLLSITEGNRQQNKQQIDKMLFVCYNKHILKKKGTKEIWHLKMDLKET